MNASQNKPKRLSRDELSRPFDGALGDEYPLILSPQQLAKLLGYSRSTIYFWLEKGRFEAAARKRGKHYRIYRDKALHIFFNGPDWPDGDTE